MKKETVQEVIIGGVTYVPKGTEVATPAEKLDGLKYVMCRTQSAGVFAGYLKKRTGQEATLLKARRIWMWNGAASLSQLATDGTSEPENCKFPCEVESVELLQVIEIIPITAKAKKSISSVPIWSK